MSVILEAQSRLDAIKGELAEQDSLHRAHAGGARVLEQIIPDLPPEAAFVIGERANAVVRKAIELGALSEEYFPIAAGDGFLLGVLTERIAAEGREPKKPGVLAMIRTVLRDSFSEGFHGTPDQDERVVEALAEYMRERYDPDPMGALSHWTAEARGVLEVATEARAKG